MCCRRHSANSTQSGIGGVVDNDTESGADHAALLPRRATMKVPFKFVSITLIPLTICGLEKRRYKLAAGIVENEIQTAELLDCFPHAVCYHFRRGNISFDNQAFAACLFDGFCGAVGAFCVDIDDGDGSSFSCKCDCRSSADA